MKEWPLNSVMLSIATHNKLREAPNGTDTQVSDLHKQQMDGQDEGSRRKYNQRNLTKRGAAIRKTPESSSCAVSEEEKKNSSSDEAQGQTLTFPPTMPLTTLLPNDPARPLTKSSQRPSSWARFSTKFIVLGLLGLGSLTSTVKDTPQIGTLQWFLKWSFQNACFKNANF